MEAFPVLLASVKVIVYVKVKHLVFLQIFFFAVLWFLVHFPTTNVRLYFYSPIIFLRKMQLSHIPSRIFAALYIFSPSNKVKFTIK